VSSPSRITAPSLRVPTNFPALTGIRFVAAAHVVLYHTASLAGSDALDALPGAVRGILGTGHASVGLFFVLSGFILSHTYVEEGEHETRLRGTTRSFLLARLARVYPLFVVGLLLDLPRGLEYFASRGAMGVAKAVFSLGLYLTALHAWHPRTATTWNAPGWSISDEAFFYALFPFAAPLLSRMASSQARVLGIAAVVWGAACSVQVAALALATAHLDAEAAHSLVAYHPLLRAGEFLLGCLAAGWWRRASAAARAVAPTVAFVAALTYAAALAAHSRVPSMVYEGAILAPVFMVLVVALADARTGLGHVLASRPMVRLGEASYALYILHMPVRDWYVHVTTRAGIEPSSPGALAVYLALVLAAALAAHRYVEEPLRKVIRSRLG
jgi:peptidoglycan/LPS O-acetylase OafA/YrhL